MKHSKVCGYVVCFSFLLVLSGGQAFAQHAAARPSKGPGTTKIPAAGVKGVGTDQVVKIRKLSGLGRRGFVKSPEFRTTVGSTSIGIDKDWTQITLEYVTSPEWIDDLSFQFYAVSSAMIEGVKTYSFYKSVARYSDVERGSHVCTMFLRPSAIKRFGELFAVAVEISYKGVIVEEMTEESQKMPPKWWKDPAVIENPNTVTREGYFITRAQSPFALVSIEGYEFAR